MDKLAEGAAGVERSTKKRKWLAAQDADPERGGESSRAVKNPRISTATPRGKTSVASHLPTKPQFLRTPGIQRNMSSKPPLRGPPSNIRSGSIANIQAWPSSPSKISATPRSSHRPPSSVTFNPEISDGFPSYPKHDVNTIKQKGKYAEQTRYFGNGGELPGVREESEHKGNDNDGAGPALRRINSITIRRQPSVDFHPRFNSQTSHPPQPQQHPMGDLNPIRPDDPTSTNSLPARQLLPVQVQVTVQTVDGFYLEFDPLAVSPGTLENLPGITEDAKKQAREDMVRLVKEAVSKWTD